MQPSRPRHVPRFLLPAGTPCVGTRPLWLRSPLWTTMPRLRENGTRLLRSQSPRRRRRPAGDGRRNEMKVRFGPNGLMTHAERSGVGAEPRLVVWDEMSFDLDDDGKRDKHTGELSR